MSTQAESLPHPAQCGEPIFADGGQPCRARRLLASEHCLAHHPERLDQMHRLLASEQRRLDFSNAEVRADLLDELFRLGAIERVDPSDPRYLAQPTMPTPVADTEAAALAGLIDFRHSIFPDFADFRYARFHEHAMFNEARFLRGARFNSTIFFDYASFQGSQFRGTASFDGATFVKRVRFMYAKPSGDLLFRDARFLDDAHFLGIEPSGGVHFQDAQFIGRARFSTIEFQGIANFSNATFAKAFFDDTRFESTADFSLAKFLSPGTFKNARFLGDAVFSGAELNEHQERT